MKNYYNKQRDNTEAQIDYLYKTKDVTFRGFRFGVEHSSLKTCEKKFILLDSVKWQNCKPLRITLCNFSDN